MIQNNISLSEQVQFDFKVFQMIIFFRFHFTIFYGKGTVSITTSDNGVVRFIRITRQVDHHRLIFTAITILKILLESRFKLSHDYLRYHRVSTHFQKLALNWTE